MLRQFARHGRYPLDHAALEITCSEIRFHLLADFFPAVVADAGVDAAVGNDLEIVVGQQQVDQTPLLWTVSQIRNCEKISSARSRAG
jgi:hypothetical protein